MGGSTFFIGSNSFEIVEFNGQLKSAIEIEGAVVFVSTKNQESCHGSQSNLKETCSILLHRDTGLFS